MELKPLTLVHAIYFIRVTAKILKLSYLSTQTSVDTKATHYNIQELVSNVLKILNHIGCTFERERVGRARTKAKNGSQKLDKLPGKLHVHVPTAASVLDTKLSVKSKVHNRSILPLIGFLVA